MCVCDCVFMCFVFVCLVCVCVWCVCSVCLCVFVNVNLFVGIYIIIINIIIIITCLRTAIQLSLCASSPYTCTDKTNRNKYT